MDIKNLVGRELTVRINRPMGEVDPVNCGRYQRMDAYVLGVFRPLKSFRGKCIAVIHRRKGQEHRLVVVPSDMHLSDNEIRLLTWFQERHFDSQILR